MGDERGAGQVCWTWQSQALLGSIRLRIFEVLYMRMHARIYVMCVFLRACSRAGPCFSP